MGNCAYIDVQVYMGGTSQDVRSQQKKVGFLPSML